MPVSSVRARTAAVTSSTMAAFAWVAVSISPIARFTCWMLAACSPALPAIAVTKVVISLMPVVIARSE